MQELIDEQRIRHRVAELGEVLSAEYQGHQLTVIGVLTGSLIFLADLIRQIELPLQVGLVQASSYRGKSTSPGALELGLKLLPPLEGRDLLLVDDIFDTGQTLEVIRSELADQRPRSVRSVVLLKKQGRSQVAYEPEFAGFDIPDAFVVGYGLDYDDDYRHLPYIATLEPADM